MLAVQREASKAAAQSRRMGMSVVSFLVYDPCIPLLGFDNILHL